MYPPADVMATNQALLADALYLLQVDLGLFVYRTVRHVGDSVWQRFVDQNPHLRVRPVTEWGVDDLLKLIRRRWDNLFDPVLGIPEKRIVDLLHCRNKWAHQDPLSDEEVGDALDVVVRLLAVVSPAGPAGVEVERVRRKLRQRERISRQERPAARQAGQYGPYWESLFEELLSALEAAVRGEKVEPVNVAAVKECGNRKSWYGSVRVRDCEVLAGQSTMAAHAKALGRVLAESGALSKWPDTVFRLTVNARGDTLSVKVDVPG